MEGNGKEKWKKMEKGKKKKEWKRKSHRTRLRLGTTEVKNK